MSFLICSSSINKLIHTNKKETFILSLGESTASKFYVPSFRNTLSFPFPHSSCFTSPMKKEQSVPKRRHIKFRRRGFTQKRKNTTFKTREMFGKKPNVTYILLVMIVGRTRYFTSDHMSKFTDSLRIGSPLSV